MSKPKFQILNKTVAWLIVINFAFFIYFLSSIPDLKSPLDTTFDIILRKIAHATEFGLLNYFIFLALQASLEGIKRNILIACIISLLYAACDEFHQSFVPGREMAFLDLLVDSCGIILISALLFFRTSKRLIKE